MKLNLTKVKKKGEDEHFFHLHDGKADFRVAKAGLSPTTYAAIVKHFDEGGEAEGVDAASNTPTGLSTTGEDAATDASNAVMARPDAPTDNPAGMVSMSANTAAYRQPANDIFSMVDAQSTKPQQAGTGGSGPAETAIPAAPKPVRTGGIGGGISKDERDLASANKEQIAAQESEAALARRKAEDEARIRADSEVARQAKMAEIDARIADNQKRGDKLSDDIATGKIDPDHFWASKSTGQQFASIIGLLLGGIGGGLNGTNQNVALQMMNKQIDADIDAQKANLGKKESLLSHYMQQGHSLQQAKQLATADMKDSLAGQLALSAAKFGGEQAGVISQDNIAKLKASGVKDRMAVHDDHLNQAMKGVQVQEGQARLKSMQALADQAPLQGMLAAMTASGKPIPRAYESLLPADRTIATAEGLRLARTADDAKDIKKIQGAASDLTNLANEIKAFRKENSGGVYTPGSADAKRGKFLVNRFKESIGHLADVARITEPELKMYGEQVNNPADTWLTGTTDAKVSSQMDELMNMVNSKVNAAYESRLMGGSGVSGGFTPKRVK